MMAIYFAGELDTLVVFGSSRIDALRQVMKESIMNHDYYADINMEETKKENDGRVPTGNSCKCLVFEDGSKIMFNGEEMSIL